MVHFGDLFKHLMVAVKQCRSTLLDPKMTENAKVEKLKWDIFGDFQTICFRLKKSFLGEIEDIPKLKIWRKSVMFQNQANSSSFIFYRVALLFNGFWKTQSWFLNHWYYISFEFWTHPSFFIFGMLWQKKRIDPQCVDHIKISLTRNVRHFWINFKFWWKSLI